MHNIWAGREFASVEFVRGRVWMGPRCLGIDQECAFGHSENSLLVQHFDNQQSRSNLNVFFVIKIILPLIKTNKHQD